MWELEKLHHAETTGFCQNFCEKWIFSNISGRCSNPPRSESRIVSKVTNPEYLGDISRSVDVGARETSSRPRTRMFLRILRMRCDPNLSETDYSASNDVPQCHGSAQGLQEIDFDQP